MLDLEHVEDYLLFQSFDFDLEVPCFDEVEHPNSKMHAGDSKATHYSRSECAECGNTAVVPICETFTNWLKLAIAEKMDWECPRCDTENSFAETVVLTPFDKL